MTFELHVDHGADHLDDAAGGDAPRQQAYGGAPERQFAARRVCLGSGGGFWGGGHGKLVFRLKRASAPEMISINSLVICALAGGGSCNEG